MPEVVCPNCNSTNTCEILYGLPDLTEELESGLNAGRVHLGGCIVMKDAPDSYCNDCKIEFDSKASNT